MKTDHPVFAEVTAKLDDKTIDVAAVWATGFNGQWRHYVITDGGEYRLISDHDHDVLNENADALWAAYKEAGLLPTAARAAKMNAQIAARLANAQPVITDDDAARIRQERNRLAGLMAEVAARRG